MAYAMGAVRPWVADIGNQVGAKFAVPSIGGWRATAFDMSGHPAGLALDFQIGQDRVKGDAIAVYFANNASALRVKYVIWQQRIWYPGKPWTLMETRPGDAPGYDPNHLRHVHVSFIDQKADTPVGTVPDAGDIIGGVIDWQKGVINGANGAISGLIGGVLDGAGNVVGGAVDIAQGAVSAALTPAQYLAKLFDQKTWLRVLQIGGGSILVIYGLVIIAVSASSSAAGAAGNVAAIIPAPQAQAAGAVLKTVSSATKGLKK